MNRRNVRDAYERIALNGAEKEKMLQNILSASSSEPAERNVNMKQWRKKPIMIAAMIGLMVFLMGCAVVALKLNDLRIAQYDSTEPAWIDGDGEKIPETEVTRSVISLQGISGSDNQKAAQEWYEFTQSYDKDNAILLASDDFEAPAEYDAYNVYSQEMIDKVDEIAEKYGLKLAGQEAIANEYAWSIALDALGIDSPLSKNAEAEVQKGVCGFYGSGNYSMSFQASVKDPEFQWEHPVWAQVRYSDKAYLDTVSITLKDVENEEQWNYTLADGTEVLIVNVTNAHPNNMAYIFCDREDAFLTVLVDNIYVSDDGVQENMSKRDIELVAELIDFTVKPQQPDMAQVKKQLDEADKAYQEKMDANMDDPFRKDSYWEVAEAVDGMTKYMLADLNADGMEECLFLTRDGDSQLYTMKDGKTEPLIGFGSTLYLCEGNVVESYEAVGQAYVIHGYYKLEGTEMTVVDRLVYDLANETWAHSGDGIVAEQDITEEEAKEIMDSYVRIELEMKPISELTEE